jgi:hypothetical protein
LAFSSFFFKLHIPNFIHLPIRTLITCDLYSGVTAYDQPKRLNLPVSSITRQGLSRVNIRTLGTVTFEQHSTSKKSESDQTKSLTPRMCCSPFHKMFKTTKYTSHQEVIVTCYLSVTSLNTQLSDPFIVEDFCQLIIDGFFQQRFLGRTSTIKSPCLRLMALHGDV